MNINIKRVKISVTIPKENLNELKEGISECEAGIIGKYANCTTSTCIGTFKPLDNANPYIGKNNKLEVVEEEKLEFVCDIKLVKNVLSKIREIHPYEEPAIDIVPLLDEELFK